jgi:hypothetical protein
MAVGANAKAAILVEGWSDQAAVETLARRHGCDLRAEGIVVVPMGGVTNIGPFLQALGQPGLDLRLAGLYDAAEEPYVRRALRQTGLGEAALRANTEARGFFMCDADLEDELIRAVGATAVEAVLEAQGELASFRRFQNQPAQRGRDHEPQLRRFMGTRARRKIRYGSLLVDALDLRRAPRALDLVLAHARGQKTPPEEATGQ